MDNPPVRALKKMFGLTEGEQKGNLSTVNFAYNGSAYTELSVIRN